MSDPSTQPGGRVALVADDDADTCELLSDLLGQAGFRTVTTGDGEAVLALAREHQPSLIVLDVMMPAVDGYTALTRLQGDPSTRGIPVIVLTGQADPVYRTLSAGVGAVAHLTKPFSARALTETVQRVLGPRGVP